MDESFKMVLFSLAVAGLGILALVLPYHLNPFRFKRLVAGFLSESANRRVPKIFGGLFIGIGVLGLVGAGLQAVMNYMGKSRETYYTDSMEKFRQESQREETELATAVEKGVAGADHFDLLLRDAGSGRFKDTLMNQEGEALARLKEIFRGQAVAPREDRSSAMVIVPAVAITFKKNGVNAVQIQLSGNLGSFNGVIDSIGTVYQNKLETEGVAALKEALPQIVRP